MAEFVDPGMNDVARIYKGVAYSHDDVRNARAWLARETGNESKRGRTSGETLAAWYKAGQPEVASVTSKDTDTTVVATATVRVLDKNGRPNGKPIDVPIRRMDVPTSGRGRPGIAAYLAGVKHSKPHTIQTLTMVSGRVYDVTKDESGAYVAKARVENRAKFLAARVGELEAMLRNAGVNVATVSDNSETETVADADTGTASK